jgi:hypothetical protein
MPYIIQSDRKQYNSAIKNLLDAISNYGFSTVKPGDLNYIISKMVWEIFDKSPSYTKGNELVGVLECVKQEFYRRKLAILEDIKIKENGDI